MTTLIRNLLSSLMIAGIPLAASAPAQEPTVILKSLDNLEKRLGKIEAETGKLKRGAPAPQGAQTPPSDSALQALSGRIDSLLLRTKSLETASQAVKTPATGAGADTIGNDGDAGLVEQIRALTALLKQERTAQIKSAPGTGGKTSAPAPMPAPSSLHAAASALPASGLELKGDIQIQGERKLTTRSNRDNLDDFWGRLNFGAEYNQGDFQSKVNIRIYPEGFGFEPLTGATFDTAGQGSLKVQTQPSSRIVINHAWAKYAVGITKLKVGRFETVETQSENFGNYVDLAPSGKFMSRPAVHNAVELTAPVGPVTGSALIGTNDRKLNRGFLRLYEKYSPIPEVALAVGFRANLFDGFKYPDDEILQRYDANVSWKLPGGWKTFAEAALLQAPGREDDRPLLLGIQPNAGKVLDLLSLEAEWLADRKAAGKSKEWLFNIHVRKAAGRFKIDAGCYSDPADADWNAVSFGLRMTSNIK